MSRRAEKKYLAKYHDSRRYLKKHPPRRSSFEFMLRNKAQWSEQVQEVLSHYEKLKKQQDWKINSIGYGRYRTGSSPERALIYGTDPRVEAVELALKRFPVEDRKRLKAVIFQGAERQKSDRVNILKFQRYVAIYLGFGSEKYDLKSI